MTEEQTKPIVWLTRGVHGPVLNLRAHLGFEMTFEEAERFAEVAASILEEAKKVEAHE